MWPVDRDLDASHGFPRERPPKTITRHHAPFRCVLWSLCLFRGLWEEKKKGCSQDAKRMHTARWETHPTPLNSSPWPPSPASILIATFIFSRNRPCQIQNRTVLFTWILEDYEEFDRSFFIQQCKRSEQFFGAQTSADFRQLSMWFPYLGFSDEIAVVVIFFEVPWILCHFRAYFSWRCC